MSTKEISTGDTKNISINDLISKIDPTFTSLDYIKRFFYQILGIYFSPVILLFYWRYFGIQICIYFQWIISTTLFLRPILKIIAQE